ncbi:MAG: DnaB-like helicase C-terminal domain-containing protein [Sediminibacterium sp.]
MKYTSTKTLMDIEFEQLNKRIAGLHFGISSGYPLFDESLGGAGFENGSLIVVGGRPGMGSTMLALNILINQIGNFNDNEVSIYIATKDSAAIMMQRILAVAHETEIASLQNGKISMEQLERIKNGDIGSKLENSLVLVEAEKPTIQEIRKLIEQLTSQGKKIKFLTIDTVHSLHVGGQLSGGVGIEKMLDDLRVIAAKFQFPVLLLGEVLRSVEYREGPKIPQLKDLKDSRPITSRVDQVYFVLRPTYYEIPGESCVLDNDFQLICKKNKYGPLHFMDLHFNLKNLKITTAPSLN